jgi:hypothetical protein
MFNIANYGIIAGKFQIFFKNNSDKNNNLYIYDHILNVYGQTSHFADFNEAKKAEKLPRDRGV